jgi:hypothetical protein
MKSFKQWLCEAVQDDFTKVPPEIIGELQDIAKKSKQVNLNRLLPYTNRLTRLDQTGMWANNGQVGAYVGEVDRLKFFVVKKPGRYAEQTTIPGYGNIVLICQGLHDEPYQKMVEFLVHEYIHHFRDEDDPDALNPATRYGSKSEFAAHVGAFLSMANYLSEDPEELLELYNSILSGHWTNRVYPITNNKHFQELLKVLESGDNYDKFIQIIKVERAKLLFKTRDTKPNMYY